MHIEDCGTREKFKVFLQELEEDVDEALFQKIVEKGLTFGLDPNIFGGSGGNQFGNGTGQSWSGSDTTAKRYARGTSTPSHFVRPGCLRAIKQAFDA